MSDAYKGLYKHYKIVLALLQGGYGRIQALVPSLPFDTQSGTAARKRPGVLAISARLRAAGRSTSRTLRAASGAQERIARIDKRWADTGYTGPANAWGNGSGPG